MREWNFFFQFIWVMHRYQFEILEFYYPGRGDWTFFCLFGTESIFDVLGIVHVFACRQHYLFVLANSGFVNKERNQFLFRHLKHRASQSVICTIVTFFSTLLTNACICSRWHHESIFIYLLIYFFALKGLWMFFGSLPRVQLRRFSLALSNTNLSTWSCNKRKRLVSLLLC